MDKDRISDQHLVLLLKQNDREAFALIYERYKYPMYIHALKMLRNEDEAQDIVQEVFTKLWDKAPLLNLPDRLDYYLFRAVKNTVLNLLEKKNQEIIYQTETIQLQKEHLLSEGSYQEYELMEYIASVVESLPPKMQKVFELSRMEMLSNKEIAEELGISDKTVKKQIQNALKLLRPRFRNFLLFF